MNKILKSLNYRNEKLEFLTLAVFLSMCSFFLELAVKSEEAGGAWVTLSRTIFVISGTLTVIAFYRLKDENKDFKYSLILQALGVILCIAGFVPSGISEILIAVGDLALLFVVFVAIDALKHLYEKGTGPKAEVIKQFCRLAGTLVLLEDVTYVIVLICQFFLADVFPVLLSVVNEFEEIIMFSISIIFMSLCAIGMLIDEKITA